jgi:N-acetylglucosamine kinase-like BadF-type ATPase
MRYYLAADGGNSKTDVVLGTDQGAILAYVRGPGASPDDLGLDGSLAVLQGLVVEALKGFTGYVDLFAGYLAGIDLPIEVQRYADAVEATGWAADYTVDNDLFALLRAGTADPDAVAVVCGAGINAVGRRADGRTARFPALGPISGDWGGGHHLSTLALWHAARGEDGRGPATALTAAVCAALGQPTIEAVGAALHLGQLDRARLDGLTPLLFDVAEAGDAVAARVVAKQANEIVVMARIAAERLGLLDRPHSIVLGGGVLTARRSSLDAAVLAGLAAVAPRASVTFATDRPIAGAALLALDHWGAIDPATEDALRRALRNE